MLLHDSYYINHDILASRQDSSSTGSESPIAFPPSSTTTTLPSTASALDLRLHGVTITPISANEFVEPPSFHTHLSRPAGLDEDPGVVTISNDANDTFYRYFCFLAFS